MSGEAWAGGGRGLSVAGMRVPVAGAAVAGRGANQCCSRGDVEHQLGHIHKALPEAKPIQESDEAARDCGRQLRPR